MARNAWNRYLIWLGATLLATLAACGAFNLFIDPLGIFGSPRIGGINSVKPYLDHHRELARWKGAQRLCPNAGIFGNSRAEIGLDPEHPDFAAKGLRAYNHAIPGTSVATAVQQLEWLRQVGCRPKTIILGVDFIDFVGSPAATPGVIALPPAPAVNAAVLAESVFSVTGVRDSLETILIQHSRYPASLTEKGFNPLLNYVPEVAHSGHHALFRQRATENASKWLRMSAQLQPHSGKSVEFLQLERFLGSASQETDAIHVVIYPYHAQLRLLMSKVGFEDTFAQWKADVLSAAQKQVKGATRVTVWDFSGISAQTLEPIPAPGDRRTQLAYYWEGGHFKRELGDLMLAQMLGGKPGFGVVLTDETLPAWIQRDQAQVRVQLQSNVSLRLDVESVVDQVRAKSAASGR
jgi:hypothetical protein